MFLVGWAPLIGHAGQGDFPALASYVQQGAKVSALLVDLESGKPVAELGAERRLSPASISKLVVAAAALQTWDADLSLDTRVMASAPISEGRVEGDLVLTGDGDPTLDHRDLWMLAIRLKAAGLRQVTGAVVVEPPFGPLPCENQDRCDALLKTRSAYDAPLSAMSVDYGTWCVEILPTYSKAPAKVRSCSGSPLPVALDGAVTTEFGRKYSTYKVNRVTEDGADRLQLDGLIASDRPVQLFRSMSDPALGLGQLFTQMLREQGVAVASPAQVRYAVSEFEGVRLASIGGLPLREQLARMNRFSNNFIADQLTLRLSASRRGASPTGLAQACGVLNDFLDRLRPPAVAPLLFSGSGLTPESRLSAADIVALLETMYHDTLNFPVFYAGLTVPEQSPFAFLGQGNTDWRNRIAVKTGTLTEPDPVRTVAGYLRKKDGGWMALGILVNGSTSNRSHNNPRFMEAIRTDVEALLERY